MNINVTSMPKEAVQSVVHTLNTDGFACIPNYVPREYIDHVRAYVMNAVERSSGQYVDFKGLHTLGGSGLDELAESPEFSKLLYDLYENGTGKTAVKQKFYAVLRCLIGETGQDVSLHFHYDSFVVTALIPIEIPKDGRPGDLLMYPNTRPIRKSYAASLIDKLFLHNVVRQKLLKACVNSKRFGPTRIKMEPGNLYLFWGYRSIHTNEPCDPDKLRATALFHYANPHLEGFAMRDKWLARAKNFKVGRSLRQGAS